MVIGTYSNTHALTSLHTISAQKSKRFILYKVS